MVPPAKHGGRKRTIDVREILNGIFYVLWTGCQWQALPKDLPPKSTPVEIIDKLNREINAALADAKIKGRLADLGSLPMPMTPANFGKLIADETEKWGEVIRAANIKAE